MKTLLCLILIAAISITGCSEDVPAANVPATATDPVATAAAVPGRVYRSSLENVPDWVPLPEEYTVIMDQGTGVGSIVIETPGDVREVVAKLNEQMSANGYESIKEKDGKGKANYMAQGVISDKTKGMAVINVGEYDGPGSSYKPGNTASISYMITRHDLTN